LQVSHRQAVTAVIRQFATQFGQINFYMTKPQNRVQRIHSTVIHHVVMCRLLMCVYGLWLRGTNDGSRE
jgi:hypothetical protein